MEGSDWLEVEKLVRGFVAMGREQLEIWVFKTKTYGVPPPSPEVEDSDDEDHVLSGEEEHPTTTGTNSTTHWQQSPQTLILLYGLPAKKTQTTATLFLRNLRNSSFVIEP